MLLHYLPQESYVLRGTRFLRDKEREEAREVLNKRPQRVARSWMWGTFPWVGCAALCTFGWDTLFPLPESSESLGVGVILVTVGLSAMGVCQGANIKRDTKVATRTLGIQQIEVWERIEDENEDDYDGGDEGALPNRVEVIAGTDEIWSEEYDWDGDEDD